MVDLPAGTVTFLFTDVEGSTKLWEQYPEQMRAALVRHDELIESIIDQQHGTVVRQRGEGDSRFAVFPRATDAVVAVAILQQGLQAELWLTPTPLRVRIALHTGEADLREGDYYGSAVNRCARLRAVAHGGQALLSQATYDLVRDNLPADVELQDMGEHRLKDLTRPEHIYQLVAPGVASDFPPLTTLDACPNNLPVQPTPFIGKEAEVQALREMLLEPQPRLVTLTGPGGTGKTRLGLQVAAAVLDRFVDGVFFVALAPINDSGLVAAAIAQALGVVESWGGSVLDSLNSYLHEKELLLLLDNFEQAISVAPLIGELLSASPKLKVLVTSREALHLYGEKEFPVAPLSLPDPKHLPPLEKLTEYEAVRLFAERAMLVKPDFAVTAENAATVVEICYRLDGLPLAIELAAARIRLLPPKAMLTRLQSRLTLLTGGARNLPARQQTLRDAIQWSYDLLAEEERMLFQRISVFVGGCTLEAIEAICNSDGVLPNVLDGISSLVDKSLLKQHEAESEYLVGEPRFWMLETIREYARERLEQSNEAQAITRRHAEYYASMPEEDKTELLFAAIEGHVELDWLEAERDNFRAALQWTLDQGEAETALRLVNVALPLWQTRGPISEGRKWFDDALALSMAADRTRMRARGLFGVASLAWLQGDITIARERLEEGASIFREWGDKRGLALSLEVLGICLQFLGEFDQATTALEEALALFRELGDRESIAGTLISLGQVATGRGDYEPARSRLEEGVERFRALHNKRGTARGLNSLGDVERIEGKYDAAEQAYEESLLLFRELGVKVVIPSSLHNLGHVALARGDHARAKLLFLESLMLDVELVNEPGIAESLAGLAGVSIALAALHLSDSKGLIIRAVQLFAASDAIREARGAPMWPAERADFERNMVQARDQVDLDTWTKAWDAGRALTVEQAIVYARESGDSG